jgi:hypothetical protein
MCIHTLLICRRVDEHTVLSCTGRERDMGLGGKMIVQVIFILSETYKEAFAKILLHV